MTGAVVYCRVSSKEQIEGTSLDSQESACRDYARTHKIHITRVFIGRGESAKFADRPELIELLDFCGKNRGRIDVLLVWKLDRLARNVADHFNIKATLLKYGIRVVSVTEPIDANPEGKLLETILAGFAQFDNDVRAMRTVQGMRRKIQEGIFPWKAPLGYRSAENGDEKKTAPDVPVNPLFQLLQKAWREMATGAYTKAEIGRVMATWGVGSRNGKALAPQTIDNLFRNKYYAGVIVDPWSREEHVGRHTPMVTLAQFETVQHVISRRSRSRSHLRMRLEFPLRGFVRCLECRCPMTSSFSTGRNGTRYGYYHCENRRCASRKSYPVAAVHDEFLSFLRTLSLRSELLGEFRRRLVNQAELRKQDQQRVAELKKAQIARLATERGELIRMRAQGLLNDEEFLHAKMTYAEREKSLTPETAELFSVEQVRAKLDLIGGLISDLATTWTRLEGVHKRRFQHCVLPTGFTVGEIGTAGIGLIFEALSESRSSNSTVVALEGDNWNQLVKEILTFATFFREDNAEQIAA